MVPACVESAQWGPNICATQAARLDEYLLDPVGLYMYFFGTFVNTIFLGF